MVERTLVVVVPGDIETRTGGYGYDRAIIAGLRERGWHVPLVSLPGEYPYPTADERRRAALSLAALPDRARVLVDGLAFGALPDEVTHERERLGLVALVHHPLGLETGIDAPTAQRLLASEAAALTAARGVVVTSPRTVAAVEAMGVMRERIAVVEPGTDAADLAPGSQSGRRRLLCVASVTPRKGFETLLDALAQLGHREWSLTVVGSLDRHTEYARGIVTRCRTANLHGRVAFAGELAGSALEAAYQAADVFVLPTHYEGYGMVVAEALARGLPVVSTPTGAIPELIGDAAGVLVPAGDVDALARALDTLLSDPSRLQDLRAGAVARRGTLPTWQSAAARLEQALFRFLPT